MIPKLLELYLAEAAGEKLGTNIHCATCSAMGPQDGVLGALR